MINMAKKTKQRKKAKKKIKKSTIILVMILLVVGGISTYLLTSPSYNIQEILVKGNSQLSSQKILQIAEIQRGDNIFSKLSIVTKVKLKQNG